MPFRMSTDNRLGVPDLQLYAVDTTPKVAVGTVIRAADDQGIMGDGEFIYMQAPAAITAGQAAVYRLGPNAGISFTNSATHANKGRPIAVALTAMPNGSYGWWQISGCAVISAAASAIDAAVYLTATPGQVSNAVLAGVQILGAVFTSGTNVAGAGLSFATLNRPAVQSQIT